MGVVFKARQIRLNRIVAVKMIKSGLLADFEEVQRFHREAEAAAALDHPNIVPVFEVGETHHGRHFFSMAFVDGESLADRLNSGPLPPREAAALIQVVAMAISYAHNNDVVHRDLKPSNVLFGSDGTPRISDFGLAKRTTADSGTTETGQVLGTPGYMAPEQAAGKTAETGPPADVYSLGALLYATLTGRAPFQAATVVETLNQVLGCDPVSPRVLNPDVDTDLETICLKCLEKDPTARYSSAAALADELGRFLAGRPILARPIGRVESLRRWCIRNPLRAAFVGLLTVLAVGGPISTYNQMRLANEARTEKDRAVKAWRELRLVHRNKQKKAAVTRAVNRFQTEMMREARGSIVFANGPTVFRQADIDRNGVVSAAEFRRINASVGGDPNTEFKQYDRNADGRLTQAEFASWGPPEHPPGVVGTDFPDPSDGIGFPDPSDFAELEKLLGASSLPAACSETSPGLRFD